MTKSITITYDEADEPFLLALLERLEIKVKPVELTDLDNEKTIIHQRIHEKYVATGLWEKLNDEERKEAVHAETLHYQEEQGEAYQSQIEAGAFVKDMNNQLLGL